MSTSQIESGERINIWAVSAFFVSAVFIVSVAVFFPNSRGDVAVLVWPWSAPSRAADVIAQAEGDLIAGTRWPFVVVGRSSDPAFVDRLYGAGAVFVLNAGVLAGCLSPGEMVE